MSNRKNFTDLIMDIKFGKSIRKNERYIVTSDNNELYNILVKCSIQANKLFNGINNYMRKLFFNNEHIPTYKNNGEKTNFWNSLLNYLEGNHITYNKELNELWNNTPSSMRKGIAWDVADKWFNREPTSIIRNRKGKNRRCSFTIKNIVTIENKKFINTKEKKCKNRYRYLMKLPKNITGNKEVFIPTNIDSSLIIEIRISPNRGRFNIDICYSQYIPQKYEKGKYPKKEENIAGIDLGIENLIAMANNVYQEPLLIRGKRLSAINAYYNRLIWDLKKENREKALKINLSEEQARKKPLSKKILNKINHLEKNRINKIHNYIDKSINIVMDYLEKWFIGTLVVGISEYTNKGFVKEEHLIRPIDYKYLRNRLKIECYKRNIKYVEVDESYTSSTSILDNQLPIQKNEEKYRRFTKRLYMTQNFGVINCDINSAIQIICKYDPNAFNKVFKDIGVYDLIIGTDRNYPRIWKMQFITTYDNNQSYENFRWARINNEDENYYAIPESKLTPEQWEDSYEIDGKFISDNIYNYNAKYYKTCIIDNTMLEYPVGIRPKYNKFVTYANFIIGDFNYKKYTFDLDKFMNKFICEDYLKECTLVDYKEKEKIIREKIKENKYIKYLMSPYTVNNKLFDEEGLRRYLIENYLYLTFDDNISQEYISDWDKDIFGWHYTYEVTKLNIRLNYSYYKKFITEKKYIEKYYGHITTRKEYFIKMKNAYYDKRFKNGFSLFNDMPDDSEILDIPDIHIDPNIIRLLKKNVSSEPLLKSKQKIMGKMITPIVINI